MSSPRPGSQRRLCVWVDHARGGRASLSSLNASLGFPFTKAGWSETREKRGIFVWGCTTKGPEAERLSCGRTPLHRHTPTPQLHRTATHACTYPHPGGAFVGGSFHCGASGYKKRPYQGGVPGAAALSRSLLLSPEMSRKEMERGGGGGRLVGSTERTQRVWVRALSEQTRMPVAG